MQTLLAVTAHPDDECFIFGGALALHARASGRAGLLCLTDGQAGRTGGLCARGDLAAVRRAELRRAAAVLGIPHLFTPGLADGALAAVGEAEGVRLVTECADRFGADVLLTFGPEGASGHGDHKACWRWTVAAAGDRSLYAATYPTDQGELPRGGEPLPITTRLDLAGLGDLKRRAFLEHRTQQDHLERFDRIMAALDGREYYHRVRPPWREGDPLETALT
ncbi:MAG: PIG-L deacetylase family protein [Planctomycetota bacterium]|jgi:LmbE family N-acetylglucosaminyl deacetylase